MNKRNNKKGFVLVYTVLILSIMVLIAGIFADTIMKEVSISRDEAESLKAFYAADTGIECIRYFQNTFAAFNPTSAEDVYNCGIGDSFTAGYAVPEIDCVAHTYEFTIDGFSNGACVNMVVEIVPRDIVVGGSTITICDAEVIANGRNRCDGSGMKVVERTRWETL